MNNLFTLLKNDLKNGFEMNIAKSIIKYKLYSYYLHTQLIPDYGTKEDAKTMLESLNKIFSLKLIDEVVKDFNQEINRLLDNND